MPTLAELRRLENLEYSLGLVHGTSGVAVVEVNPNDPVPDVEIDDFTGDVVVVKSGAIESGAYRCTVNGEWRAGLAPQRFDAVANDHEYDARELTHKDRLETAIRHAHRQRESAQERQVPANHGDGVGTDIRPPVPTGHARARDTVATPSADASRPMPGPAPDGVLQPPPAPMPIPAEPSYILNMSTGRRIPVK